MKIILIILIAFSPCTNAGEIRIMLSKGTVAATPNDIAAVDGQRAAAYGRTDYEWNKLMTDSECHAVTTANIKALLDCMYHENDVNFLAYAHAATCNMRDGFARQIMELFTVKYKSAKFGLRDYEEALICAVFFERWRFEYARMVNASWRKNGGNVAPDVYAASDKAFVSLREACMVMLGRQRAEWSELAEYKKKVEKSPWPEIMTPEKYIVIFGRSEMTREIEAGAKDRARDAQNAQRVAEMKAAQRADRDRKSAEAENERFKKLMNQ